MNQEIQSILAKVDHTLLAQSATWNEIKAICDDGVKYGCASVCIPASYVKRAAEYVDGKIAICTVIGFPNGYDTTAAKCFEAEDAVNNGASEVDMVINIIPLPPAPSPRPCSCPAIPCAPSSLPRRFWKTPCW